MHLYSQYCVQGFICSLSCTLSCKGRKIKKSPTEIGKVEPAILKLILVMILLLVLGSIYCK